MRKKILMPKVVVYRDIIKNIDDIFNLVKISKESKGSSIIPKWENWNHDGFMSTPDIFNLENVKSLKTEQEKKEYLYLNYIYNSYWTILKDYISDWKLVGSWPYVKDWTLNKDNKEQQLQLTNQILLTYSANPNERLAMNYHTDEHQFNLDAKGSHLFITITVYLNDDYDGGELSFLNEESNTLIYYKPKAGDITVFPSFLPFYHGVEALHKNEKYLIRNFITCEYEGSEEWNKNFELHGKDTWEKIEKDRIEKEWNDSKYYRLPVFLDDDEENDLILKAAHGKRILFPLTKKEAKEKFLIRWENES